MPSLTTIYLGNPLWSWMAAVGQAERREIS